MKNDIAAVKKITDWANEQEQRVKAALCGGALFSNADWRITEMGQVLRSVIREVEAIKLSAPTRPVVQGSKKDE